MCSAVDGSDGGGPASGVVGVFESSFVRGGEAERGEQAGAFVGGRVDSGRGRGGVGFAAFGGSGLGAGVGTGHLSWADAESERGGGSRFTLGSTEENLAQIRRRVAKEFPGIRWAGSYAPPFKAEFTEEEDAAMVAAVNESGADVLWVGMTAPKQEIWIHRNLPRLNVQLAGAIGAAFDFYSGKVKRSHWVWRRLGLEWFPRLVQEPRRLWRRMLVSAPVFVWEVLRERLSRGR